jgi:LAO/AO transport system kinase
VSAAAAVLNLVESTAPRDKTERDALLAGVSPAALGSEAPGHIVGITGPPGVGKSSLLSELCRTWRERGRTVAVLAVDPSSKRSGGALLGDRARIQFDPSDKGLFIRSTATGTRLGGLASATRAAAQALAAAFDIVVIETVGVGQSETEIGEVADTVAVVVQPGSGDALQFLKSGIMEIPDLLIVTKADLGQLALSARRDLSAALRTVGSRDTAVLAVSSIPPPQGFEKLADALDAHRKQIDIAARRTAARRAGAISEFAQEHGERGMRKLGGLRAAQQLLASSDPAADQPTLVAQLEQTAG